MVYFSDPLSSNSATQLTDNHPLNPNSPARERRPSGNMRRPRTRSISERGCWLSTHDYDRLKIFVHEFVVRAMIPWAERLIKSYHELVRIHYIWPLSQYSSLKGLCFSINAEELLWYIVLEFKRYIEQYSYWSQLLVSFFLQYWYLYVSSKDYLCVTGSLSGWSFN